MSGNINFHLLQPRGGAIEPRFEAIGELCFLHDQEKLSIDLVGFHGWTKLPQVTKRKSAKPKLSRYATGSCSCKGSIGPLIRGIHWLPTTHSVLKRDAIYPVIILKWSILNLYSSVTVWRIMMGEVLFNRKFADVLYTFAFISMYRILTILKYLILRWQYLQPAFDIGEISLLPKNI